ncbi:MULTISPECIES: hypothetical protein [Brevibacillus]|uniref:hypothetical protein n=1 Tax=Brevibacillus TaxID=55080 RepID=UPI00362F8C95
MTHRNFDPSFYFTVAWREAYAIQRQVIELGAPYVLVSLPNGEVTFLFPDLPPRLYAQIRKIFGGTEFLLLISMGEHIIQEQAFGIGGIVFLTDIERKILRIIGNYWAMKPNPPSIDVICVKTRRSREDVMTVLEELAREKYIEWRRTEPDKMEVFETWERKGRY